MSGGVVSISPKVLNSLQGLLGPKAISTVVTGPPINIGTAFNIGGPQTAPAMGKSLAPVSGAPSDPTYNISMEAQIAPKASTMAASDAAVSKAGSNGAAPEAKAAGGVADGGKGPAAANADAKPPPPPPEATAAPKETAADASGASAPAAKAAGTGREGAVAAAPEADAGKAEPAGAGAAAPLPATTLAGSAPATVGGKEVAGGPAKQPPAPASAESIANRKALIRNVFKACDNDGDGLLSEREMLRLAVLTGFEGTATKWSEEYKRLCTDNSRDPAAGVDIVLLEKLLNDSNDEGEQYTSDEELQGICTKLAEGDKNGLDALMNARAAAELGSGISKAQAPTGQLAARMQTPKVPALPFLNFTVNMPKALQFQVLKPLTPRGTAPGGGPFSKGGGMPLLGGGPRGTVGKSSSMFPRVVPARVVPPPAMLPPGRMEADEGLVPAPEGSSPKVLGGAPPGGLSVTHFSKSAGAPPLPLPARVLAGSAGAVPKDASQMPPEEYSKSGALPKGL